MLQIKTSPRSKSNANKCGKLNESYFHPRFLHHERAYQHTVGFMQITTKPHIFNRFQRQLLSFFFVDIQRALRDSFQSSNRSHEFCKFYIPGLPEAESALKYQNLILLFPSNNAALYAIGYIVTWPRPSFQRKNLNCKSELQMNFNSFLDQCGKKIWRLGGNVN